MTSPAADTVACPHCARSLSRADLAGHAAACAWTCRPSKASGYRYVVAVMSSVSAGPMILAHSDDRPAAKASAKMAVAGRLGIYGLVEVRVIRQDGRVTDRWVKDRTATWRHSDVVKQTRGADAAQPLLGLLPVAVSAAQTPELF